MKELIVLFISFFKIGAITFGGGLAMLPIMQREVVESKKWATEEELVNYYAVGQCTPGIIAVNTATFIGYKQKGILGAVIATFGVVCPSLLIIMSIAAFIQNFTDIVWIQNAFSGIRIAVAALITDAVIKLWKSGVKDVFGVVLFIISFIVSAVFKLSPVYMVAAGIVLGILFVIVKEKKGI